MNAKTPGTAPNKAELADEALRTARRAMRLVAALHEHADEDSELSVTARASALGLLTVHAQLAGKPDPTELHKRTK